MKLRYWLMVIVAVLFLGGIASLQYVKIEEKVDMPGLNERFCDVKDTLEDMPGDKKPSEQLLQTLEEEYQCEIIWHDSTDYETGVYNAIQEQKILLDVERDGKILAKVAFAGQAEKTKQMYRTVRVRILIVFVTLGMILLVISLMIYWQYIRPFRSLQRFTAHVAKGDLDFPLAMTKDNYFGAFTESFDIMREELKKARQGEYEANVSKKELVASLSHDIKTPVSTIKAICEILMLKVKDEATLEKIITINQKAGMIDSLISDMFHATLEDLTVLKITPREELSTIIRPMFDEINHYGKIHYENEVPECIVIADALRLNQVIDNIINNSYKYAGTDIVVAFHDAGWGIEIVIKDSGAGVTEEELPLLQEKFYRGSNAQGQSGSGLGLYLSKVFMEGMGGTFSYESNGGFIVRITVSKSN